MIKKGIILIRKGVIDGELLETPKNGRDQDFKRIVSRQRKCSLALNCKDLFIILAVGKQNSSLFCSDEIDY